MKIQIKKFIIQLEQQLEDKIYHAIRKWTRVRMAGLSPVILLAFAMVMAVLISDHSSVLSSPKRGLMAAIVQSDTAEAVPIITYRYGIPITVVRDKPNADTGLNLNSEVALTDRLAAVAHAFDRYLDAHGEYAIITSGYRSPATQLDIIKERIDEHDASSRFPKLDDASVADIHVWLRAWRWLAHRHVPVNAPLAVDGANVSMHTKGRAMDFISSNLDRMRDMLAGFARSKYAREAPLHITAIVREPGCVHINLG